MNTVKLEIKPLDSSVTSIPGIHRFLMKPITKLSDPIITLDQAPSTLTFFPFPEPSTTFLTGLKPPDPPPSALASLYGQLTASISTLDRTIDSVLVKQRPGQR
jgi:hypothetical protein